MIGRQREAFEQRHDVDAAGLQHGAVAERDLVQLQMLDALRHRGVPGQEARAHPIGDVAEPQVEARGLDLVGREVVGGQNPTRLRQRRDHAIRQDALLAPCMLSRQPNGAAYLDGKASRAL